MDKLYHKEKAQNAKQRSINAMWDAAAAETKLENQKYLLAEDAAIAAQSTANFGKSAKTALRAYKGVVTGVAGNIRARLSRLVANFDLGLSEYIADDMDDMKLSHDEAIEEEIKLDTKQTALDRANDAVAETGNKLWESAKTAKSVTVDFVYDFAKSAAHNLGKWIESGKAALQRGDYNDDKKTAVENASLAERDRRQAESVLAQ